MEDLDEKLIESTEKTPVDYIRDNIEKANVLLDLAMNNISERQKVSAEMMKSIAGLVDAITTAASTLISAEEADIGLQLRAEMLSLKKRELDIKLMSGGSPKPQQQNIFVGSFNELLKQINSPSKMIENEQ